MIKLLLNVVALCVKPFSKVLSANIKAKAEARSNMLDYETELAKQMKHSWKDEYLTLVFTCFIPIWMLGALLGAFDITADVGNRLMTAGDNMGLKMKEIFEGNFHYIITLIVSASFGIHVSRTMKAGKLGSVVKDLAVKKEEKKKSSFWGNSDNSIHDIDRDRK